MMIKVFFKSTALIVISACIGLLALMAVYALPTEPMSRHVKDSIEIYQKEGLYYSWAPGKNSSQIDNFTDSIMLRETIYPADGSVLENALLNPNFGYKDDDQVQSLIKQLQGEKEDFVFYYSRYWHGYLFFLKPALLITNISNIRMANALLQMFLAASIIYLLGLKLGRGYAFSYFLTYLFLNPISLALSFQYSTMYYLMSFISLFILLRTDWVSKGQHFLYVFLFLGILTAFFDFLTYPLISIGIPLTIFLLLTRYYQNTREIFQTIILSTVFWGFGYGGMYISKWDSLWRPKKPILDVMTGYRAFSPMFVKTFPVLSQGFEIETEMTIHALDKNLLIQSIPVQYRDRPEGSVSKLNTYSDGCKVLLTIFNLYRDYKPMQFFGIVAAILAALSIIFFIPVFIEYINEGIVPRFPTFIASAFLMMSALLSFGCGLILDTNATNSRKNFEIQMNIIRMMMKYE